MSLYSNPMSYLTESFATKLYTVKFKQTIFKKSLLIGFALLSTTFFSMTSMADIDTQVTHSYHRVSKTNTANLNDSLPHNQSISGITIPQHWELDLDNVTVRLNKISADGVISGDFPHVSSEVHYDRLNPDNSHLRLHIDIRDARITDTATGEVLVNIFDTERYPQVSFLLESENFNDALSPSTVPSFNTGQAFNTGQGSLVVGNHTYPMSVSMLLDNVEISAITDELVIPFELSATVDHLDKDTVDSEIWSDLTLNIVGQFSYVKLY